MSDEPNNADEQRPVLGDSWFNEAQANLGEKVLREVSPIMRKDLSTLTSLDSFLFEEGILEEVTNAARERIDESRKRAVEILDFHFGLGKEEAHEALRTNSLAKRIYDCAIQALTTYDLTLVKSQEAVEQLTAENEPIPIPPEYKFSPAELTPYEENVSTESLNIIRSNECNHSLHELSTKRFRAFWNEIVKLRLAILKTYSPQK